VDEVVIVVGGVHLVGDWEGVGEGEGDGEILMMPPVGNREGFNRSRNTALSGVSIGMSLSTLCRRSFSRKPSTWSARLKLMYCP